VSAFELGLWSFPVVLALIFLRVPIGLAMLGAGMVGSYLVIGSWNPMMAQMKSLAVNTFSTYSLSIIPLFLLMGQFATLGGMSTSLFKASETLIGHRRGGVAMAAIGYMIAISIYVRLKPGSGGGNREKATGRERLKALADVWPVAIIFALVVGGIYAGWFTPTEGAAVGAAGTGLLALINGGLNRETLVTAFLSTAITTGLIFFIVFGAGVYNSFLALSQVPNQLGAIIAGAGFSPWLVLVVVLLMYLVLGCLMDSLSMILLTIPIVFPIVSGLDYGLSPNEFGIWFGILILIVVEVGLITPPVGMNLFVINSMARDIPISATYRGVIPFVAADVVRTVLLVTFPVITLFLIRLLG
jgi:TRAP-type C4-dicarboxylate transport system permease large subunit